VSKEKEIVLYEKKLVGHARKSTIGKFENFQNFWRGLSGVILPVPLRNLNSPDESSLLAYVPKEKGIVLYEKNLWANQKINIKNSHLFIWQ